MEALATSPIASWSCDRETLAVVAANDAARRAFGWTAPDGVHLRDVRAPLEEAARTGQLSTWTQGGVEIEAAVVATGEQWLVQAVRVGLRRNHRVLERLAPLLDLDDEGLAISDASGVIEYISPAF